jgi:peptidyl-prolyl cis-trans isomerase C
MRRSIALCLTLVVSALSAPPAAADGGDEVVVTVGDAKLTASEIERRLGNVPTFQLSDFGSTSTEVRKNFVNKVLVPELLLSEEARRRGLDKTPANADRIRGVLTQTLNAELKKASATPTPDEIKSYYDENRHRFNTPQRIKIWRILVRDEASAQKIIGEVKSNDSDGSKRWNELARESMDTATALRGGDLGFVRPDGQTETPQLRVDPALFAAADKLKDGELGKEPVKEGDKFAVIWRRGNLDASVRTLDQEAPSIRQILSRKKLADALEDLTSELRQKHAENVSYELLSYVNVEPNGDVGSRQRPGVLSRRHARGTPAPAGEEHGSR